MRNFFVSLLLTSVACSNTGKAVIDSTEHTLSVPNTLVEILTYSRPIDLYREAYASFRFSSNVQLRIGSAASEEIFEGRTFLEWDPKNNFHLSRKPLDPSASVEVIYVNRETYLRRRDTDPFAKVRYQAEFNRWVSQSVQEVFQLFGKAGFNFERTPESEGEFHCWKRPLASLCTDPVTRLPMKGTIRTNLPSQPNPEIRFEFVPAGAQPVTVIPPMPPAESSKEPEGEKK